MPHPEKPLQLARVLVLADCRPDSTHDLAAVDQRALEKIRKCLARAQHPNTPEAESRAAYRAASQFMNHYNIKQSDVVVQATTNEAQNKLWGQSDVIIERSAGDGKKVLLRSWISVLASAMNIFFNCCSYNESSMDQSSFTWVFYGVATNTAAAAMAFESAHNLISVWAARRRGRQWSYLLGAADALVEMAQASRRQEEEKAREQERQHLIDSVRKEEKQREREIMRLAHPTGTSEDFSDTDDGLITVSEDRSDRDQLSLLVSNHDNGGKLKQPPSLDASSNDDSDRFDDAEEDNEEEDEGRALDPMFKKEEELTFDFDADFEEELRKHMPKAEPKFETPDQPTQVSQDVKSSLLTWSSTQALVKFRESTDEIAQNYLKTQGIKLKKGRAAHRVRDWEAYDEGVKDGSSIDVKRRRIEDGSEKD